MRTNRAGLRDLLMSTSLITAYGGEQVLVDEELMPVLKNQKWHVNGGYVRGYINGKFVKIHRLIMNPPDNMEVDHINGNPLDNRRANLRVCTKSQNQANRRVNHHSASGYKGVTYDTSMQRKKRWGASILHEGKRLKIGRFHTKEEAAEAYNLVAYKLRGEYAKLNKIVRVAS